MAKKIVSLVVLIFLLAAIPITYFVLKQRQEVRQKAAPASTLSFSPSQKTVKAGDTFPLNILIDTAENSVVTASLYITYDATKLSVVSLTNAVNFPNILTSADITTPGKASIAVSTQSYNQPYHGSATVAVITFKALASTTSSIQVGFGSETYAGGVGEGNNNVLIQKTPSILTITGETVAEPTPTSTPSITPTSPPRGTPTKTPTPTKASQGTTAIAITAPKNGSTISTDPPTISGTAPSGYSITITSYPGTLTGAVTATSTNVWTFRPTTKLGEGNYTLTIVGTNPTSGVSKTITSSFVLSSTSSATLTSTPTRTVTPTKELSSESSESGTLPVTGSYDLTLFIVSLSVIFLISGTILFTVL